MKLSKKSSGVPLISLLLMVLVEASVDKPITCYINFSDFWSMWANLSTEMKHTNDHNKYNLIDYSNYATSFAEFREKYPTVTIETSGYAISDSTFGDVGEGRFGTLIYSTEDFIMNPHGHFVYMVDKTDSWWGAYWVETKIGVGFKRTDTQLFLLPYVSGVLKSHGKTRYLKFGLGISTLTFNPRRNALESPVVN